MNVDPQQIAGVGLIAAGVIAAAYKPVLSYFQTPVKSSKLTGLGPFEAATAKQNTAYRAALKRIEVLESELEAIRKVVGISPAADEVE